MLPKYWKRWTLDYRHGRGLSRASEHSPPDQAKMKVWLDDVREAPEGWIHIRTPEEAIDLLRSGAVEEISLDHDLGIFTEEGEATGYDVLLWIEAEVAARRLNPPVMHVHSANPVARRRMGQAIASIKRLAVGGADDE